MNVKINKYSKQ